MIAPHSRLWQALLWSGGKTEKSSGISCPIYHPKKTTILLIAGNFWDLPKKFKKQANSRSSSSFFLLCAMKRNERKVYECHPMDTHARHSTDELLRSLDLCQAYTACGSPPPLGFGYKMQMRNIKQKGPSVVTNNCCQLTNMAFLQNGPVNKAVGSSLWVCYS